MLLSEVLFRFLQVVVPRSLRLDPSEFVRAGVIAILPFVYCLCIVISFLGHSQFWPTWWMFTAYALFPVFIRLSGSYRIPAYVFLAFQYITSYMASCAVNSHYVHATTAVFLPMVRAGERMFRVCAGVFVSHRM